MTVISIEMLREHRYRDDSSRVGDMRVLPRKWSGELDEEAAVVAIATGAARPRIPLTKDQALAVEVVKAARARDYARIEQLRAENPDLLPPPASSDGQSTANETQSIPTAKARKSR